MAPRIPPPERLNAEQLEQLAKTRPQPQGRPLNLFATLARRPQLLRRVNALGGYFPLHSTIGLRERELVILRTAARTGGAYEEAQHRAIAAEAGMAGAEIAAAADPSLAHDWSAEDAALLAFCDELLDRHSASDAVWSAVALDDDARLELLVLIGFYALLAGFTNAINMTIDAPTDR